MDCSDHKDDLLEVLYGEASPETRERLRSHQQTCVACREELATMQRLRRDLAEWRVPEAPRGRPAPSLWTRLGLSRGLAAAAVLLLAAGGALGLSGVELQFEKGPWTLRLGRAGEVDDLKKRLASLEERRGETDAAAVPAQTAAPSSLTEDALLQLVREQIQESEARQASVMRTSLLELSERAAAQRRYDLARVSAGLSYLDGKTGQQVARTTELMGYVLQASQKR